MTIIRIFLGLFFTAIAVISLIQGYNNLLVDIIFILSLIYTLTNIVLLWIKEVKAGND